jgi:Tfp pilus assembly protein PilP
MRMYHFGDLRISWLVAGAGALGMMLVSTLLFGQGNETNPVNQQRSAETSVAPPTAPLGSSPALAETSPGKSPEPSTGREKVRQALLKENLDYSQYKMVDPFVSFIAPVEVAPSQLPTSEEDFEPPPEPQRPLTPLQKMNLGELERGLKAIAWGELGRRALVEDSAGKGYIVSVGTPAGERNGVITDIFNDRIIVQQQFWDGKAKRLVPQNFVVKLKKLEETK